MDPDLEPPTEQQVAEDARTLNGLALGIGLVGSGVVIASQLVRAFQSSPVNLEALGVALLMIGIVVAGLGIPIGSVVARRNQNAARITMIALFVLGGLLVAAATLLGLWFMVEAALHHSQQRLYSGLLLIAFPVMFLLSAIRVRRKLRQKAKAA